MAILQVQGVRGLAWLLPSLQEGCLCLESQHQHPEHRSPERQTGTAGYHLTVAGMPMARELQLGRDVPIQNRDLELWDLSTRRERKKQKLRAQQEPLDTPGPPNAHTASFHLPSLKTRMDLSMLIGFLCLCPSILPLQQNQVIQVLRSAQQTTLPWLHGSWFKDY